MSAILNPASRLDLDQFFIQLKQIVALSKASLKNCVEGIPQFIINLPLQNKAKYQQKDNENYNPYSL